jgi:hypothetical protein
MTAFGDQLLNIGAITVVMWRVSRMLTLGGEGVEGQLLIDHRVASRTKSLLLDKAEICHLWIIVDAEQAFLSNS